MVLMALELMVEGLYLDSSGVQGDFDVVRISSVWCMTAKSTGKCTMQVNMFFRLGTKKPAAART